MAQRPHQPQVPRDLRPVYDAITTVTDEMCREHLTDEYADLVRSMTAALCRKRPSPVSDLPAGFGVSKSTVATLVATIRPLARLRP